MSDVGSVSGSRPRFSDEEIEAMRKDEPTSAIANKARRDAGLKEKDVTVRGDDKTLEEVLTARKTHVSGVEVLSGLADGMTVAEAVGVEIPLKASLGKWPEVVLPIAGLIAAHVGMIAMENDKAAMKDGATRDQLHAGILDRLELPKSFKDAEMKKLDVSMTKQSTAYKVSAHLDARAATLQLHCDEGMHAARTMLESSKDKTAFLKENPTIAKRYAEDAAYHNGFDALCWSKNDKAAPTGTYEAQVASLESRDARYAQSNITLRM